MIKKTLKRQARTFKYNQKDASECSQEAQECSKRHFEKWIKRWPRTFKDVHEWSKTFKTK